METTKKQVKKHPPCKNLYLYISKYVFENKKLPSSDTLGISDQARNYYVKQLKIDEIIYRKGYGVWEADNDKIEQLLFLKELKTTPPHTKHPKTLKKIKKSQDIRGHGYTITVEIPKKYHRNLFSKQLKIKVGGCYINNGHTITTKIKERKVWFSKKTIVIYFQKNESIYGETAEDCEKSAIYIMRSILGHIERTLSIDVSRQGEYSYRVSRSHYAHINNELAKDFNNRNKKLKVFYNGKCWLLIDKSFNVNEFEFIGRESKKDCDKAVMPFFNDLKAHYDKTEEVYTMSEMLSIIGSIAQQNKETATGLNAVVKLMQVPQEIRGLDKCQTELRQYTG